MKQVVSLVLLLVVSAACRLEAASSAYFADDFERGVAQWTLSGSWGLTASANHSQAHSLTDSPSGNYAPNTDARATLARSVDLSTATAPVLRFWHRYQTALAADVAYVQVSTDGGFNWEDVASYLGTGLTWNEELINLTDYKSANFKVRFRLVASYDSNVADGWYIDDVAIEEKDPANTSFPFCDKFEGSLMYWTFSGSWGLTTSANHSQTHSLTDSPSGNYAPNTDARATLARSVDLSTAIAPVLRFWHRYQTALADDVAYVQVSTDGGFTWEDVASYLGTGLTWNEELINLTDYKSANFKVRFRLVASYDSNVADGWYIDDIYIGEQDQTWCPSCEAPTPPLLVAGSTTVKEGETLSATVRSTDPDAGQTITFSLLSAPTGMTIAPNTGVSPLTGTITWTPTEAEGPGDYTVQVVATDNCSTPSSAGSNFTFTVAEVNLAPVLATVLDQSVVEMTALTYQLHATDADLPANTLTFGLLSGPPGLTVSATGLLRWTPEEGQGPGTYDVTVQVTDHNPDAVSDKQLSDSQQFRITVQEVNRPPQLGTLGPVTIDQCQTLQVNVAATDPDLPTKNTLTFSLPVAPPGMTIAPATGVSPLTGLISWTPTTSTTPGKYPVTVRVTDNGALSADQSFEVTVEPCNTSPTISCVSDQELPPNGATTWLPFQVGDRETPNALVVSGESSNTKLVPVDRIFFYGEGAQRYVLVMPTPGESGRAAITLCVTDSGGLKTCCPPFQVVVCPGGPDIVQQPAGQVAEVGDPVTFTVKANAEGTLFYQWQHEGIDIPGATTDTLALPSVSASDAGSYTVVVSDGVCSATSATAQLRLVPELECEVYAVITVHGIPGHKYLLQYSESTGEPHNWQDLGWIVLEQSPQLFIDTTSSARTKRFYRAVRQP